MQQAPAVADADACKLHMLAGTPIFAEAGAAELVAADTESTPVCRATVMHRALPWRSGWQLSVALLLCLSQLRHAAAQTGQEFDWMDHSYSTEYRAASVVTNLWIAAFAVTSALFGLLGEYI
jgi:hypothetical protein